MDEYTCAECGGTFNEGGRSDEERQAEAVAVFGVRGDQPGMAKVCDVCYQEIMGRIARARAAQRPTL